MVDWNTKEITKNILVNNWSISPTPNFEIKDDEQGKLHTPDYPLIEIEEVNNRNIDQADIQYETFDKTSFVLVTVRVKQEDVNRYWQETISTLMNKRTKLEGLSGEWDKIIIGDNQIPDPQYSNEVSTIQVQYQAFNDKIN